MIHRGWVRMGVAVAAVVSLTALAGCSSSGDDESASTTTPTSVGGSASSTVESTPSGPAPSTPADASVCRSSACPSLPTPSGQVKASGVTAANADSTVPHYLDSLLDDLDETWGGWFTRLGWGDPAPGRVLIEPGTRFRTECTAGDDPSDSNIPSDLPNAFFCSLDVQANGDGKSTKGSIVLPVKTFQGIWNHEVFGVSTPVAGDFTAATVVAHEYGHNVMYRIADVLGLSRSSFPTGNNPELLADCLAGNWAATVYQRDALSPKDIIEVATLLPVIGDPGPNQGHGTIRERATALTVGLTGPQFNRQGQPGDCLTRYWPEAF